MVRATAVSFVSFYNRHRGSRYEVADLQASHVRCVDKNTLNTLNLEICVVQDAPGEAGRGAWMGSGPMGSPGGAADMAPADAVERVIEGLRSEIDARPRADTALVVRQSAAIWSREEWTRYLSKIPWSRIGFQSDIFDRGIWVLYGKKVSASSSEPGDDVGFLRIDPYRPTGRPQIYLKLPAHARRPRKE